LRLRADKHAQYEIRVYAETIGEIVQKWVPRAFQAFLDYQLNSIHLSSQAVECLKTKLKGEKIAFENSGMSKREWNEFLEHFPEIE
jgi:thymidylate synthase (FAD)